MRTLFLIGGALVMMFMAGWFTIHRDGEHTTIKFNKNEIKSDTASAKEWAQRKLNEKRDGILRPPTSADPGSFQTAPGQGYAGQPGTYGSEGYTTQPAGYQQPGSFPQQPAPLQPPGQYQQPVNQGGYQPQGYGTNGQYNNPPIQYAPGAAPNSAPYNQYPAPQTPQEAQRYQPQYAR